MKYVIVKTFEGRTVRLTMPATSKQAHNSFERFKKLGLSNIQVLPVKKARQMMKQEETSGEFLKAKKDFEAQL